MTTEEERDCWFVHAWAAWSEAKRNVIGDRWLGDYQERRCLHCNKIQRRML